MLQLENNQLLVELKSRGAELTRIYQKETEIDYLWEADPAFWGRHAPILFPTVGRLVNDTYYVDGEPYQLGQHGFARDRDFEVIEHTADTIVFQLTTDEATKTVYPYSFALRIRYTIEGNAVRVGYEVENTDTKRIYFSIGAHPAFQVPLLNGENFEDYYLDFHVPERLETLQLEGPYRNREIKQLATEKTQELPLRYDLFANDALIFEGLQANTISIRSHKHAHFVTVAFPDFPFVGIWTPRAGAPFLCIEPWFGIADELGEPVELRDKAGIEQLDPEAIFAANYEITFG